MSLVVHIHAHVHYHIHLIVRRNYVKGLMHMDIKSGDTYYDSLPYAPPVKILDPDIDTTTYQIHVDTHMHVHVYPTAQNSL